jgi:hypothetical protein
MILLPCNESFIPNPKIDYHVAVYRDLTVIDLKRIIAAGLLRRVTLRNDGLGVIARPPRGRGNPGTSKRVLKKIPQHLWGIFDNASNKQKKLTLGELEATTSLSLTVLLTLYHTTITR